MWIWRSNNHAQVLKIEKDKQTFKNPGKNCFAVRMEWVKLAKISLELFLNKHTMALLMNEPDLHWIQMVHSLFNIYNIYSNMLPTWSYFPLGRRGRQTLRFSPFACQTEMGFTWDLTISSLSLSSCMHTWYTLAWVSGPISYKSGEDKEAAWHQIVATPPPAPPPPRRKACSVI